VESGTANPMVEPDYWGQVLPCSNYFLLLACGADSLKTSTKCQTQWTVKSYVKSERKKQLLWPSRVMMRGSCNLSLQRRSMSNFVAKKMWQPSLCTSSSKFHLMDQTLKKPSSFSFNSYRAATTLEKNFIFWRRRKYASVWSKASLWR